MKDRADKLGQSVHTSLERLVRELLSRKPSAHLIEGQLERLELKLPLFLRGKPDAASTFSQGLIADIDRQLDAALTHAATFRPGHAYCLRCEEASCEHTYPPSARHVFAGYSQTGLPQWADFGQFCLDRKHPQVDRLYSEPPAFLTVTQSRAELRAGLLDVFEGRRYQLLGQVVAGFYRIPAKAEEGRGILALTVQAAASIPERGPVRLGLNLLGRDPSGEGLDALWQRCSELPWRRAVRWAQDALRTFDGRRLSRPEQTEERVQGILRGLARRLERDSRARTRRTRHAEERHEAGSRPTRNAVEDARQAGQEDLLFDVRRGTLVVLGDRGRTHFFSSAGQLVSSVRYSREAIEKKIKAELWRPAEAAEREALRRSLPE